MARDKSYEWRTQGLALAYKEVEEAEKEGREPKEALRRLMDQYRAWKTALLMTNKELDKATEEIKKYTIRSITIMALIVLRDEFDFGTKRLQRFMDRWEPKAVGLLEDGITWKDLEDCVKEETGIDIVMPWEEGAK